MEREAQENPVELTPEQKLAMEIVRQHISKYDFVRVDGRYKDIRIDNLSPSDYDQLYETLEELHVFPWIEDEKDGKYELVIERQKELQTLHSFFKASETSNEEDDSSHSRTLPVDDYRFPLQPSVKFPKDEKTPNRNKGTSKEAVKVVDEEDIGVDEELRLRANDFDQGFDPDQTISAHKTSEGKRINLKQFPQQYFFKKGRIFDKEGAELSLEEHKEIILAAKNSPEMTKAVKLSTGLVIAVVNRILEKFSGNSVINADDLFQVGMEGLMYGLERIEGREDSSPSSYLVPCIEGYIRSELSLHRKVWRQPSYVSEQIGRLRKARILLERNDPDFQSLSRIEQLESIATETGMPINKIIHIDKLSQTETEEFDDDNQEHNVREDNNPMIDIEDVDYQKLKEELRETLGSLTPREDLMIRLYFCIPDPSPRWREDLQKTREEMFGNNHGKNALFKGSFEYLVSADIERINESELNAAERVFLVLIGKLPESSITDLEHHDKSQPSPVTLEDLAAVVGTARERPRQIIARALRLIKHPSRSKKLRKFMDEPKPSKYRYD